jgi:hypothetical protein
MSIMGKTSGAAVRMYQVTYIMGFFLGCILHLAVNKFFPPPGLGVEEDFHGVLVEGVAVGDSDDMAKTPIAVESKLSKELEV